ncbi:MAG: DUF4120 domain-containing protein [Lachnoclostridium sp.]|jgi:hypothetical protein|nr:DUF4120 domain-containing protein [Lachnoclostridium sp.]
MKIKCEEHYQEVLEHAKEMKDETLQKCLDRLKAWEKNGESEIILYKDFAPFSFYFVQVDMDGNRIMNGGLLYHGSPDESFAVQLIPSDGWQIHT